MLCAQNCLRTREAGQVHVFSYPLIGEDNRDIRILGESNGGLRVRSAIEIDLRIRQSRSQRFQRRSRKPYVVLPVGCTLAWRHDRIPARRVHLRRSSSGDHADIGMSTDHRNAVDLRWINREH
jgi:hypothetical protein